MAKIINGIRFQFGKGTQDKLLSTINDDEYMIKHVHDVKGWACGIIKQDQMKDMVKTNNQIFEVVHRYPVKVFFDIDGKPNKCNLDDVKVLIDKYFNTPKMAVSGYENEDKVSYHIVLPNLLIKDYNDLINMKKLVQKMQKENENFDDSVYSKNRLMKAVNQSKPNKAVQAIIEDDNIENHFITTFIDKDAKPFIFEIDYDSNKINASKIPKNTPQLKEAIENNYKKFKPTDHDNALKLLNLMPCDFTMHHSYCWKFQNFAFHNGLSFDEFWSWNKQKRDCADRRNRYVGYWNKFNSDDKKKYNIFWIKSILSIYVPNIHVYNDVKTNCFMKSFDLPSVEIPVKKMETYETADISNDHFTSAHKVAIFNVGMGGGKTGATVKYLKDAKQSFIWFSVRVALAMNTNHRFVTDNLDVYKYNDSGNSDTKRKNINKAKNLLISTESLHYLEDTNKFDVLVIDEIESLLNNWDSTTHGKNLENNFYNFKALIQHTKKIILLDAFTTTKTIDFIKSLGISDSDIITYTCNYKQRSRNLINNDTYEGIVNKMINDVDQGKKIFVFYPFLNDSNHHDGIKSLECELLKKCTTKPNIITYMSVASDKVKKTTYDVNNTWKDADIILTTSSITVGVNYEGDDFDKIYLLTSGMCNLARDLTQVSLRIRNPRQSEIETYFFDKSSRYIYEYNDLYKSKTDLIYNSLIDSIEIEKTSDFISSLYKFADQTGFIRTKIKPAEYVKIKTEEDSVNNSPLEKKQVIKVIMEYKDIDVLSESECKDIEINKVWVSNATMEEKFKVSKYYFDKRFQRFSNEDREFIWNNRLSDQFKNLYDPLIQKIEADNKCGVIELDFNKIVISDDTRKYIKETYNEFKHKNDRTLILKLLQYKLTGFTCPNQSNDVKIDETMLHLFSIGRKYKVKESMFHDD
jgi:hypothetical protein